MNLCTPSRIRCNFVLKQEKRPEEEEKERKVWRTVKGGRPNIAALYMRACLENEWEIGKRTDPFAFSLVVAHL